MNRAILTDLPEEKQYVCELVHPNYVPVTCRPRLLPQQFIEENKLGPAVATHDDHYLSVYSNSLEKKTHEEIQSIIEKFERSELDCVIIKSILPLPKQIGDIDFLVNDLSIATSILESMGYVEGSRQPYKRKFECQTDSGVVKVHLHEEIAWHGEIYLDKHAVLADRITTEHFGTTIPIPSPTHEALITAAHMLFEKGNNRILLLDVLNYWSWANNEMLDINAMRSAAEKFGWLFGLECFFSAVASVYECVYQEPFSPHVEFSTVCSFDVPFNELYETWVFTLHQMYQIRKNRIASEIGSRRLIQTLHMLQTYVRDFGVECRNRYGLTYTKKRVKRWNIDIRSTD